MMEDTLKACMFFPNASELQAYYRAFFKELMAMEQGSTSAPMFAWIVRQSSVLTHIRSASIHRPQRASGATVFNNQRPGESEIYEPGQFIAIRPNQVDVTDKTTFWLGKVIKNLRKD